MNNICPDNQLPTINDEVKIAFGVQNQEDFNKYLKHGKFLLTEDLERFCKRTNGIGFLEQVKNQKKLKKKLNKKQKEYKIYTAVINNINPILKKILIKKVPNKQLIIINVFFRKSDSLDILNETDPLIKITQKEKEYEIEYSFSNVISIEINYILTEIDLKILEPENIIFETNEVNLKSLNQVIEEPVVQNFAPIKVMRKLNFISEMQDSANNISEKLFLLNEDHKRNLGI